MSHAKDQWFLGQEMEAVITSIAIELGVLQRHSCDEVVNPTSDSGDEVREEALERFRAGDPSLKIFEDEDDVEDAVERVFGDHAETCSCFSHRNN
ncbi:hypothetical protein [Corallococcus sp. RDP092CA]|uniref:hypothetical protein n=1 Tax=Corallococcus sp. RDP092CA TaxID=3109369 RepID=UPI0035AE89DE